MLLEYLRFITSEHLSRKTTAGISANAALAESAKARVRDGARAAPEKKPPEAQVAWTGGDT